jgi:fatty-acyl-CoA synthase/long-chain acyl-CoA synthetase
MTHPSIYARTTPNKIAYQMAGTGKAITYRKLDELSNQGANLFRSLGVKAGDHIALLMENRLAFMEICWAAQRSGLYYTAISRYLKQDEIDYIIGDCGAKVVITTPKCAEQIKDLVNGAPGEPIFYMVDEPLPGFRSYDKEAAAQPTTCYIHRARPGGRRASRRLLRVTRSTRRTRSCACSAPICAA